MKTLVWIFLISGTVVVTFLLNVIYASDDAVNLLLRYQPRPPFIEIESGKLAGLCGGPAVRALEEASIPFTLVNNPPFRQLALMQTAEYYDCSVGWLKIPERAGLYKYSEPVCDDGVWLVVGHKGSFDKSINKAEDLLKNRRLKLINRKNYSFGEWVDTLAKRYNTDITSVENAEISPQMFEMIRAGRVDYTFVSSWEFDYLLRRFKWAATDFVVFQPIDNVHTSPRHIICSKKVPDEVMRKLNDAIRKITLNQSKTESK
jgi:ABC-type amino acid transport substrate-binding protein